MALAITEVGGRIYCPRIVNVSGWTSLKGSCTFMHVHVSSDSLRLTELLHISWILKSCRRYFPGLCWYGSKGAWQRTLKVMVLASASRSHHVRFLHSFLCWFSLPSDGPSAIWRPFWMALRDNNLPTWTQRLFASTFKHSVQGAWENREMESHQNREESYGDGFKGKDQMCKIRSIQHNNFRQSTEGIKIIFTRPVAYFCPLKTSIQIFILSNTAIVSHKR